MLLIIDIIFVFISMFLICRYLIPEKLKARVFFTFTNTPKHWIYLAIIVSLAAIATSFILYLRFNSNPNPFIVQYVEVDSLSIHLTPNKPEQLEINTPNIVSATISAPDSTRPLSQLIGSYYGSNASLQNLLGVGNTSCISATLEFDPDQVNVEPPQTRDYPLNQSSLTWQWIVIPKQAAQQLLLLDFQIAGETHCGGEIVTGPYPLSGNFNYSFTVVDPNENPIISTLKHIDVGGAITAALGTILASLCIWIGRSIILKRANTGLPGAPSNRIQKKKRRRTRR